MGLKKNTFEIEGKFCVAYTSPNPKFLLIQPVDEHDLEVLDAEVEDIASQAKEDFCLVAFKIKDWNQELAPWSAAAVFGKQKFGDGAKDTLIYIENELIPYVLKEYNFDEDIPIILGGYSLAALFSLWSAYESERFKAIAAASPSVWFDGWIDYIKSNNAIVKTIYLSLGDKEEKTRNKVMASVGERIREQYQLLKEHGVECVLEWNQGNHFHNSEKRCAKGFVWCMKIITEQD